tara:strand:- start:709 stop:1638 length:930 start_codon:yes stop_codon:yes gene_type:complete
MPGSSTLGGLHAAPRATTARTVSLDAAPAASTRPPVVPVPARLLTRWNAAMALFHATLAVTTLALGKWELRVPVYKTGLDFVERQPPSVGWDLIPVYVEAGSLPFTLLVALFFALTGLAHLLNATLWRAWYLHELARCRTPTRWLEYAVTAGLMMLLIAYTLGLRERALLACVAVLVSVTMPFGYWVEVVSRPASPDAWAQPLTYRLFPWFLGNVPQATAWGVVVLQFYTSALTASDRAPAFVHAILWSELLLFFSFGFVSLGTQLAPPRRFYQGELAFQVLSLGSKGLLGGLLLANVLMRSRFEEIFE